MNRSMIAALLLVLLLAPGAALAEDTPTVNTTETTSTPTPLPSGNDASPISTSTATSTPTSADGVENSSNVTAVATIDRLTVITDYYMHRGDMVIKFHSDGGNTLAITETTNVDGAVQVRVRHHDIPRGSSKVRIDVIDRENPSVLITTRLSLKQNTGTKVSIDNGDSIVEGPYDGSDVRDAAIGGAFAVAIATLYEAAKVKLAANQRGERVA